VKVFCKRTLFNKGEEEQKWGYVRWRIDSWYQLRKPSSKYEGGYVYGYIITETRDWPISHSDFNKYFYTQEELRDKRINDLIN